MIELDRTGFKNHNNLVNDRPQYSQFFYQRFSYSFNLPRLVDREKQCSCKKQRNLEGFKGLAAMVKVAKNSVRSWLHHCIERL
jgi:hypothetical protein